MKKTSITQNEFLQLLGLLVLAETHRKQTEYIRLAAHTLLGLVPDETNEGGHIDDAIWSDDINAKTLLKRLNIEVLESDQHLSNQERSL